MENINQNLATSENLNSKTPSAKPKIKESQTPDIRPRTTPGNRL